MPGSNIRDEIAHKHARVAEYLSASDLDAVLLGRRCNFSWYTCGAHNYVAHACDVGNSFLLVDRTRARVLTNNIEAERLEHEELADTGIEIVRFDYFDPCGAGQAVREAIGPMRAAADADVGPADLPRLDKDFDRLRWQLTADEIARYGELCRDSASALESAARSASPGWTENELAAAVAAELRRRDCLPWVLLVGSDDRLARFRHPLPTAKRIGDYFMVAACAERRGLICAASRLASFGPVGGDLARRHEAVATVDAALILATRVGATLGEIFDEARRAYEAVGFPDEWRHHHQGGSCGYLPREVKAAPGDRTVVLADQPFAWNPSIAGTKSEDTILCRTDGPTIPAGGGDWPTIPAEWDGRTLHRPAILTL